MKWATKLPLLPQQPGNGEADRLTYGREARPYRPGVEF